MPPQGISRLSQQNKKKGVKQFFVNLFFHENTWVVFASTLLVGPRKMLLRILVISIEVMLKLESTLVVFAS